MKKVYNYTSSVRKKRKRNFASELASADQKGLIDVPVKVTRVGPSEIYGLDVEKFLIEPDGSIVAATISIVSATRGVLLSETVYRDPAIIRCTV